MLDQSQEAAYQEIIDWTKSAKDGWFSLGGVAGSGKTTLIAEYVLPELVLNRKLRIAVATPTARAARVLAEKLSPDVKAQLRHLGTIHSLLYKPILDEYGNILRWVKKSFIEETDLILVDECSMVDHVMEEDLLGLRVPIIAVGDHAQLPPVNGISTWMRRTSVLLDRVHRQALESPVLRLATTIREIGRLPLDLKSYDVEQHLKFSMATPRIRALYREKGLDNIAIACFTNANRCRINLDMQQRIFKHTTPCQETQVVCLKNNKNYGICNGDRGILQGEFRENGDLIVSDVQLETGDRIRDVRMDPRQFGEPTKVEQDFEEQKLNVSMDYGYALTCHKMQGSSFDEVFILKDMPRSMDEYGRWMYTAVTRAVNKVHFISRI